MKQTQKKRKKKTNSRWPWIVSVIVLLVIGVAVFAGARLAGAKGQTATAYLREGSLYLQRTPGDDPIQVTDSFPVSGDSYVKQTATGDFLLYPSNLRKAADGSVSSYDLYAASTRGREAGKGFLVAESVFGEYKESADGKSIAYLRGQQSDTGTLCTYQLEQRKETVIDANVTSFERCCTKDDPLYYLRLDGSTRTLCVYTGTEKAELDREVTEFHLYPTETAWELFYLKKPEQDGTSSLYKKGTGGNAQLVAEGVSRVRFDQYVPGGPLYYLCPSAQQISWTDLIEDDKKNADAALQEPKLSDFVGGVLDSLLNFSDYGAGAYHTALTEYNEKLKRDKIREELSSLNTEGMLGTSYDCYAFIGTSSILLAENLRTDSLYAASPASPAIVSRSYTLKKEGRPKLSTLDEELLAQAEADGWESFLTKLAQTAMADPTLTFTTVADGKNVTFSMENYPQKGSFAFSDDGTHLYILEEMEAGGTLCRAAISQSGLTEKTVVDTNVSRYAVAKDTAYYLKGSNVQSGTLYKFTYSESVLIENDVRSLEQLSDGNLLYYRKSADGNTALFLIRDGESILIGEHVLYESAEYTSPERILFIRNPNENGVGELCWYRGTDKTAKIDENVQDIFF